MRIPCSWQCGIEVERVLKGSVILNTAVFKTTIIKNQGLWAGRLASVVTRLELSTC